MIVSFSKRAFVKSPVDKLYYVSQFVCQKKKKTHSVIQIRFTQNLVIRIIIFFFLKTNLLDVFIITLVQTNHVSSNTWRRCLSIGGW